MKIQNTTKVLVLAKVETQGIKDPTKKYYSLTIMQDTEAGALSVTEEVYNAVNQNEVVELITEFNQNYNSFRCVGLVPKTDTKVDKPKA